MSPANIYNKPFRYFLNGIMPLFSLFLLFFLHSCRQDSSEKGISEAFKPVNEKVLTMFGTNRLDSGMRYLDSVMKKIHPTNDDKFRVYAFHYVYALRAKHDNKLGLLCADSMLMTANLDTKDPKYIDNYAEANFAVGDAYFNLQQYNDAYPYYYKGYLTGQRNLDNFALADYNYRMGMIMYRVGNFQLAKNYFKRSYALHNKTHGNDKFVDFYAIQEILDNIALSFKHNSQPDSAIVYFNKTLSYLNKEGPQFTDRLKMIEMASGVVYGNKAEVLILKGDYENAIKMLKKSIAINLKKDYDNNDAELAEIKLAQLYYDRNDAASFYDLLNNIHSQFSTVKNENAMADWNRLMSNYYLQKKDLPKALTYLRTYNVLKDSITKKLDLLKESDINKQLDTYEKEQQIEELSNNNRYQKIYLLVITFATLMTLIIVLLVYRNWRRSKADILKVNNLNTRINEQNLVLENALNELKDNNFEKDRILRTVAHDLRNPLGGIASVTAMMAEDDCTEEQKEWINLVNNTAVNSLELINELLEATENSAASLNTELADINPVVSNGVELLRFKAEEKNQQINFTPLNGPQELYISREKIGRVLGNLISNAIKFSPEGSTITVSITEQNGQVVIAVEDNGIGIPEDVKGQIFNMYTSAQRLGTSGEKSFGLGLSICKQIMELFGGKIWFESKASGGTVFYISLPLPDKNQQPTLSQEIGVPLAR